MTLDIGRVQLASVSSVKKKRGKGNGTVTDSAGNARATESDRGVAEYEVEGIEVGAGAVALMDDLEAEVDRVGDVYVVETNDLIPEGYYKLVDVDIDAVGPNVRAWKVKLRGIVEPIVTRQAEDDNTAGTDTSDVEAEEGVRVAVVNVGTESVVLDSRNAAGEAFNLPAGDYRVLARVKANAHLGAGSHFYTVGQDGDDVHRVLCQTKYDMTSQSTVNSTDVSTQATNATGIAFGDNGTKMYVADYTDEKIHQYALSTPWDTTTRTFTKSSIEGNVDSCHGLAWSPDGVYLFSTDHTGMTINRWTASTPWDVGTIASYTDIPWFTSDTRDLYVRSDGLRLYLLDSLTDKVYEFRMTKPFDLDNAVRHSDVDVRTPTPTGLDFSPDGKRMWILEQSADDVYEYELATPWVITSATEAGPWTDLSSLDTLLNGFRWRGDGGEDEVLFRCTLVDETGTTIQAGSQVGAPRAEWAEIDLGTFTIPQADDGENEYEIRVEHYATGSIDIDRVRFVRVA